MASIGFTIKWAGRMLFHRARLPRLSKRAQCAARAPRRTRSHYTDRERNTEETIIIQRLYINKFAINKDTGKGNFVVMPGSTPRPSLENQRWYAARYSRAAPAQQQPQAAPWIPSQSCSKPATCSQHGVELKWHDSYS